MQASSRKRTLCWRLIEAEQRRSLDRLAVNAAATLAQRGEIALTRLRYADAAKHFADAAAVFPPGSSHETERMRYLDREAQAHYRQGDEFGDNDALQTAIARNKRLVELQPPYARAARMGPDAAEPW